MCRQLAFHFEISHLLLMKRQGLKQTSLLPITKVSSTEYKYNVDKPKNIVASERISLKVLSVYR